MKRVIFLCVLLVSIINLKAQHVWHNVRMGGGGSGPGIIAHPQVKGLFYARCDVGNAFRWEDSKQKWTGLLNWVPDSKWWLKTAANIAIDPTDTTGNLVYAALGTYPESPNYARIGGVYKSKDRGDTWYSTGLNINFASNNDQKAGERLMVDPVNGDIIICTSRQDGTYMSNKAGEPGSWTKISSLNGIFVIFDKSDGLLENPSRCKTIYIGVPNSGIYASFDGGTNFNLLSGSPLSPYRAAITSDGVLFVTHSSGVARFDGTNWKTVTPPVKGSYSAVAVNPQNPQQIIVSRHDYVLTLPMFISNDQGNSWVQLSVNSNNSENPWSPASHFTSSTFSFAWDPFNSKRVWFSDWYNTWETLNIDSSTVLWKSRSVGYENTVTIGALLSPPTGNIQLYSGFADIGGFDHLSLTEPPTNRFIDNGLSGNLACTGVAIQETNPNFIIRVGRTNWDGTGFGAYSTDEGKTYIAFSKIAGNGGRVAISANSQTIVWATQQGTAYYSNDLGNSWNTCTGAPSTVLEGTNVFMHAQTLAADKIKGSRFYIYNNGKIYRSDDTGKTFSEVSSSLPSNSIGGFTGIHTSPKTEGDLWVNLDWKGLYHSDDAGSTFVKIDGVERAKLFAIGKESPVTNKPAIYVYGVIFGKEGIFMSDDYGKNWLIISDENNMIADALDMTADRRVYGRVFLGTGGNGIFYAELSGMSDVYKPTTPENVKFRLSSDSVLLEWNRAFDQVKVEGYRIYNGNILIKETSELSTALTGLTINKEYNLYLSSYDNSGNESEKRLIKFNYELTPPTPPANPLAIADRTFINLSWSPSTDLSGIKGYTILLNNQLRYQTNDTSIFISNLSPATDYTISIVAIDSSENHSIPVIVSASTLSNTANFVVNADFERGNYNGWVGWGTQKLTTIEKYKGDYGVEVPACGAAEQTIVGLKPNTDYILSAWIKSSSANTIASLGVKFYGNDEKSVTTSSTNWVQKAVLFTTGADYSTAYIYFYSKCSNSLSIFADNFELTEGKDTIAPTLPTNLKATPNTTYIKLTWTASDDLFGIKGYNIYQNGTFLQFVTTKVFTVPNLLSGTVYEFGISAIDNNSNESVRTNVTVSTIVTDIEDTRNLGIQIYPNPATDNIKISNIQQGSHIQLVTISGNIVYTERSELSTVTLYTSELPEGVYLLKVTNDIECSTYKILKLRE